ncbi:unnamed protein product [Durusdinium trenchii]|uniref:Pseudouridine synthase RsuA/RluA-like domain-containing protein n=1 Tax=Durusdinium trenchii TaxID=1381693 RepID=A0ABP0SXX2_9DINO
MVWSRVPVPQRQQTAPLLTKRLVALGSQKRWAKALQELFFAQKGLQINVLHFNALAGACSWPVASKILQVARNLGICWDVVSYSTVLNADGSSQWARSIKVLEDSVRHVGADLVTWSTAVTACRNAWVVAGALASALPANVKPDVAILAAHTQTQATATPAMWPAALEQLRRSKLFDLNVNAMFLSTTLGVLGHHSAWHAVVAMWQLPLQHTMFGANAVLKAAVKGYRWQAGLFLLRTLALKCLQCDAASFNSVMDGARGARWWQVSELLGAMRQKQVHCTEVSINVAMAVLSQAGCWDKALRLSLQAFGFDAIRTRESLAACEKAGSWSLALCLLNHARERDLKPARVELGSAARSSSKAGQWQHSLVVLNSYTPASFDLKELKAESAEDLAQLAWLGAQQGNHAMDWRMLAEVLAPKLGQLDLAELSSAVWSFGTLSTASRNFVEAASRETRVRLSREGVDATPRMLADLAWGLASLDLAEVEVYSVVQWQLARLAQGLDMKKPAKILKDFIKKSLVVVWVSSFQRCLHDGLYQVLAKRFNRLAKLVVSSVSSTTTAMPTHEHQIQPGDESPSIVLDLPDRLVVQKPPSWQVDDGKDDPESSRGRLSTFLSTRFSCPILREVEHQRGFLHRLDVPTSGLILVAKEHRAYYDLQLQLAAGQVVPTTSVALMRGWTGACGVAMCPVWCADMENQPAPGFGSWIT